MDNGNKHTRCKIPKPTSHLLPNQSRLRSQLQMGKKQALSRSKRSDEGTTNLPTSRPRGRGLDHRLLLLHRHKHEHEQEHKRTHFQSLSAVRLVRFASSTLTMATTCASCRARESMSSTRRASTLGSWNYPARVRSAGTVRIVSQHTHLGGRRKEAYAPWLVFFFLQISKRWRHCLLGKNLPSDAVRSPHASRGTSVLHDDVTGTGRMKRTQRIRKPRMLPKGARYDEKRLSFTDWSVIVLSFFFYILESRCAARFLFSFWMMLLPHRQLTVLSTGCLYTL